MAMGEDPYDDDLEEYADRRRRRRNFFIRTVALVVLLAFGASYAAVNISSFFRNRVGPAPQEAAADPRGFKFLHLDPTTQQPVRYDPCTPIHYVVNPENAPKGGIRDIHDAVRLTAEASGLRFLFDGEVDEPLGQGQRAWVQEDRYGPRWAPLLIGWIPFDSEIFEVDGVGVAGSTIETNGDGRLVYVSGTIVLNGADQLDNGFRPGKTWGKVVLHELGHVLGLDHVLDPAQVMHPSLVSSPAEWGTGDLAALRLLGPTSGCLAAPPIP